jgi:hypothetical protein
MTLHLPDLYEAYHRWKNAPADKLLCSQFFISKLPSHWGYVIAAGTRVLAEKLQEFEISESFLNQVQDALKTCVDDDLDDFINMLSQLHPSWRVDAVHDGTFLFGSQPCLCLQGNTFLTLIMLKYFEQIIENSINTATQVSRLKTALGEAPAVIISKDPSCSRAGIIGGAKFALNHGSMKRTTLILNQDAFLLAPDSNALLELNPSESSSKSLELIKNLPQAPRGIIIPFAGADTELQNFREALTDRTWLNVEIYCSAPRDEQALKKQKANGVNPDYWLLDFSAQSRSVGTIQVQALKSAICNAESKWTWLNSSAANCAFPYVPGFLNIRRYGKRRPAGDMIVNEHVKAGSNIINDREFLTRSLRGDFKFLLEPVFMGRHFTLLQGENADARHAQFQKELFGDNYTALDFPAAYPSGIEENFYNSLRA